MSEGLSISYFTDCYKCWPALGTWL